jgi:hypothetical protein
MYQVYLIQGAFAQVAGADSVRARSNNSSGTSRVVFEQATQPLAALGWRRLRNPLIVVVRFRSGAGGMRCRLSALPAG